MLWNLEKRKKVLRITMNKLYDMLELKLVLIKLVATYNRNYNHCLIIMEILPILRVLLLCFRDWWINFKWQGFTPEELRGKRKSKGKEVIYAIKDMEINKPVNEEEDNKFLTRIFLMSLILSFEPHHNALQIVLNKVYVPQIIA